MPSPISDDTIDNLDSLKLLKIVLSDYEIYFGQLIVCLKNLNQAFQEQTEVIEKLKLDEKETKELFEVFHKIQKMLESSNEPNNVKRGLKLFEESTHGIEYTKLLSIRNKYPALLSGTNTQLQAVATLLEDLDDVAISANKSVHSHHPDITFFTNNIQKINESISKIPNFQLVEYWRDYTKKYNEGIIQIENSNKILNAIATRSCSLLFYYLFSRAQTQKLIEGPKVDCKVLAEMLLQDKILGKVANLVSKRLPLVENLQIVALNFEKSQTQAKQLDNFHKNVLRIAYLDQGFSLSAHHSVGYCDGAIRVWSQVPAKAPIKKKEKFSHCLELHEEDADNTTLVAQLNQISDHQRQSGDHVSIKIKNHYSKLPLFSEEALTPENAVKFENLQKFINDMLHSVKDILEKNNFEGAIEISLDKKGNKDGHAIGFKISFKDGILHINFRDENFGEFSAQDFQLFQNWFAYYFCVTDYHKEYNGYTLYHLIPKSKVQQKISLKQSEDETNGKQKLETKAILESDEELRNQITNLIPELHQEVASNEAGMKIVALYEKIKERNENDHVIAEMCYINCSQSYPDGTQERLALCQKAVEVYKILVQINLEHSYSPIALLNLAEFYLINLKLGKMTEGIQYLQEACNYLIKIDPEKLDHANPEVVNQIKTQAQELLSHITGPKYPEYYNHLIVKFKDLAKIIEDEHEAHLTTPHVLEIMANTLYHHTEELEFGENENQEETEEDEALENPSANQATNGNPQTQGLHFQYQPTNGQSPDSANGMGGSAPIPNTNASPSTSQKKVI